MKRFLKNIFWRFLKTYFSLLYPLNRKQIYFRAYNGLQYACNPKSISEAIHAKSHDIQIFWSFNDPSKMDVPDYIHKVKKNSWQDFKALFTSKFWVMNAGMVIPTKRKGQVFIDTWHGDRAFKNVSMDIHGKPSSIAYEMVDYVLSGSDYADRVFLEQLKVKAKILKTGSPRNDIFFKDYSSTVEKVRKFLSLDKFDKILTYAPTFRGPGKGMEPIDFSGIIDGLEKRDGKRWGVLIRQHHKVPPQKAWTSDSRIVDASAYPEMQDILLVSDMVISDYSSLVGDYILLKRPVILFVPDINDYKSGRGLNFEIEKSPFIYAKDEKELTRCILNFNEVDAVKNCEDILNFYGHVCEDGSASEQACRWIMGKV